MKQVFIFFLAITFVGLLTIGCGSNNTDSTASFDVSAMKKIIEEKKQSVYKSPYNRPKGQRSYGKHLHTGCESISTQFRSCDWTSFH